ncbi:mediator of RNA polymerase II transcription subunit 13 [Eurosta solidaginis]|uniref:mediator of RNA polymerase II transcription subunit 13 n=1 Tax=Eurosta solidaginis TaxID=178769 RepID=UPI00353145B7
MLPRFSNDINMRGSTFAPIMLMLLLCSAIVTAGSISSSHKAAPSQQQQQMIVQQPQPNLQQQHPQQLPMSQQQQQQSPSQHQLQQQYNQQQSPPHQRMQEQEQNEQQLVTTQNFPNDLSNDDYIAKDVDIDEEIYDPYQYLSNLKLEPRLTAGNGIPWNPYRTIFNQPQTRTPTMYNSFSYTSNPYSTFSPSALLSMITPRFMPFFSYPQPVYLPLPMYLATAAASSDIFYPDFIGTGNDIDDSMPRAIGNHRRVPAAHFDTTRTTSGMAAPPPPPPPPPASARNSQIYFMRLAPMPYSMFMPGGLGFAAMQGSLPVADSYNPLSSAISPILNIPMNFMANGKPTNIYQIGGTPNDFANPLQFNNFKPFGLRPPTAFSPPFSLNGTPMPGASNVGVSFSSHGSYGPTTAPQSDSSQQQDSKLTLLKRPFFFNGRPDEIYTLPNNFNSIYGSSGYY